MNKVNSIIDVNNNKKSKLIILYKPTNINKNKKSFTINNNKSLQ